MGRFIVVVLVIAAIAFLANKYLLNEGDQPPPGALDKIDNVDVNQPADDLRADAASTNRKSAGQDALAADTSQEVPGPDVKAAADDAAGGDPAAASDQGEDAGDASEDQVKDVEAEGVAAEAKGAEADPETILLGVDELYDGVPGEGDLTVEQLKPWLADPKNHVTLKPELPLGLAAGAAQIKGLDDNPLTRAKIELGRQLFFDPRISSDNTISCASCHDPDFGYGKNTQFGVGVGGQTGNRNSPVAYNRILSAEQFWDGRAPTLEEQAKGPIANPIEMASTHEATVADLKTVPEYVVQFEAVFGDGEGDDAVDLDNAAMAIAAFERTLVTGPTPWDYYQDLKGFEEQFAAEIEDLEWLKDEDKPLYDEYMELKKASEDHPITESARRGGELFFADKAGCTQCHLGANFTDEKYHNLGVGMDADEPDLGRYEVTKKDEDRGAFKTPTIRNVSTSGPYMHDGTQKTLEEVVEWYDKGGHPNEWLSDKIKPLKLTDQEKQDLVAFMKQGLQGELPKVERERIPAGGEEAKEQAEAVAAGQ